MLFYAINFGGKIRKMEEAINLIKHGADKIVINSLLFKNKVEVTKIIETLGSQAVVASVDYVEKNKIFMFVTISEKLLQI